MARKHLTFSGACCHSGKQLIIDFLKQQFSLLCPPRLIYLIKRTVKIVKYYYSLQFFYFNISSNVIYSCDGKAVFLAAITIQFSVAHDPSEIIRYADLVLKKLFLLEFFLKTVVLNIFENRDTLFSGLLDDTHLCQLSSYKWSTVFLLCAHKHIHSPSYTHTHTHTHTHIPVSVSVRPYTGSAPSQRGVFQREV